MRTEGEIKSRIQDLILEEAARRTKRLSERLPHLCVHNYRHPLDARKRLDGDPNANYNRISDNSLPVVQTIGLCMLGADGDPAAWAGNICDEPLDAKRCPYFTANKTRTEAMAEFETQLQDSSWVAESMPELYALLWVLGSMGAPRLRWWQRLLLWVKGSRLEPAAPAFDPTKLLPSGS